MAHHKQAIKRIRQNERRAERNLSRRTQARNAVRKFRAAVQGGKLDEAKNLLSHAERILQKTASAGVVHKKNAARRISRLYHALTKAKATA